MTNRRTDRSGLNLNQIAAFLKVVETGSFTSAGTELALSASAVSKHVAQLEESLGVRLLTRTTRRLALTEAGTTYAERCGTVMSELDAAAEEARGRNTQLSGRLRVLATSGVGQRLIAPLTVGFMQRHETVSVDLTIGEVPTGMMPRNVDILVTISNRGDRRGKSVHCEHLHEVSYLVCASRGYLDKRGRPKRPEDLKEHNCLIHERQRAARLWRFQKANGAINTIKVDGMLATNNAVALEQAVVAGLGIGRVPDYVALEHIKKRSMVVVFDNLVAWGQVISAYSGARSQSSRTQAFVDYLKSEIPRTIGRMGK
jgi:DNA-binding transcriptional LysR family regulator